MRILAVLGGMLVVLHWAAGCTSIPPPRLAVDTPRNQVLRPVVVSMAPSPSLPVRRSGHSPGLRPPVETTVLWLTPLPPILSTPVPVPAALPLKPSLLPLPEVRPIPVKATPLSRSWIQVAQAKPSSILPIPTPINPLLTIPKVDPKLETKPPVTVQAQALPPPAPKAVAPATAAATALLLPLEEPVSADFHWEDVNAVAGDAVTLHFDRTNWLYLDPPAQQKILGFQSINRDKAATTFLFKPLVPGQYTLEFQRQDLVNQTIDLRKVKLTVVKTGTRTSSTGSSLAPQTSTAANNALEASRLLSASGKTAEAVKKLLQSYKADDSRVNLELARLLNQQGQADEALSYLDKNLTLTGPDFQGTLELGTRLAATGDPQKKLPAYVKLWTAGISAPPEELFIQVLETLRTQKMTSLIKDWSGRYSSWYPVPKLRDRYLFQLGQWLEEPGVARDVRGAWKAFNEVVQTYPLSPYWKASGERAAYINRHFLQVR